MPLRSKCQFEYAGSALEDVLAGVKVQGIAHVYRCRHCPCIYATSINDRIV